MRTLLPSIWSRRGEDPFTTLQSEINRMFEDFGRPARESAGQAMLTPRIEVRETESALEVTAELPGIQQEDIQIDLQDDMLVVRGEKRFYKTEEKSDLHLSERAYGSFSRSIGLPFRADAGQVQASMTDGILKITVPKPQNGGKGRTRIPIGGPAQHAQQAPTMTKQ